MFPKEATIRNAKNKSGVQISNKAYNIWWISRFGMQNITSSQMHND